MKELGHKILKLAELFEHKVALLGLFDPDKPNFELCQSCPCKKGDKRGGCGREGYVVDIPSTIGYSESMCCLEDDIEAKLILDIVAKCHPKREIPYLFDSEDHSLDEHWNGKAKKVKDRLESLIKENRIRVMGG